MSEDVVDRVLQTQTGLRPVHEACHTIGLKVVGAERWSDDLPLKLKSMGMIRRYRRPGLVVVIV